jgi:hypothetical protein
MLGLHMIPVGNANPKHDEREKTPDELMYRHKNR